MLGFHRPEDWAKILSVDDLRHLINLLQQKLGIGLDKVCKEVDIEKKTVYNWSKVLEARDKTKIKVLKASLRINPLETLEFIQRRLERSLANVILTLFRGAYKRAMSTTTPENFEEYLREIEAMKGKYAHLISKNLSMEIGDMLQEMYLQAKKFSLPIPKPTLESMNAQLITGMLTTIVDSVYEAKVRNELDLEKLADELQVPAKVVEVITDTRVINDVVPMMKTLESHSRKIEDEIDRLRRIEDDVKRFIEYLFISDPASITKLQLLPLFSFHKMILKISPSMKEIDKIKSALEDQLKPLSPNIAQHENTYILE